MNPRLAAASFGREWEPFGMATQRLISMLPPSRRVRASAHLRQCRRNYQEKGKN